MARLNRMNKDTSKTGRSGEPAGTKPVSRNPVHPLMQLQQTLGNREVNRLIQAKLDQGQAGRSASGARFGPYAPENYAQLLSIARTLAADLRRSLQEVDEGAPVRAEAEKWLSGIEQLERYMERRGEDPLDTLAVGQAAAWYYELIRLRENIQVYKREQIERNLEPARAALANAAERITKQRDNLREGMRSAFLSGDENALAQAANYIGTATDIGMGLHELARQMSEALAEARGGTIPPASRYTAWVNNVNRFLAAANLLYSLGNIQAPTELATATNGINAIAGIFSSGGTLLGLSAHMGLYANLYLVPLTQAIMTRVNALLSRHLHEINVVAAHTDFPLEMSSEPGGWPMYRFMTRVMRAERSRDVLFPVPQEVADYLVDHRGMLARGAGSEVPTTGWIWRDVHPEEISDWVFANRERLWSMFYGSMPVPRGR